MKDMVSAKLPSLKLELRCKSMHSKHFYRLLALLSLLAFLSCGKPAEENQPEQQQENQEQVEPQQPEQLDMYHIRFPSLHRMPSFFSVRFVGTPSSLQPLA